MTELALIVFHRVTDLAIALGGNRSGEHVAGRRERDRPPGQLGEDVMQLNRRVKNALDPSGRLYPGAVFS